MAKIIELTDGVAKPFASDFYPEDEIELYNPFVQGAPMPYEDGELKGIFAHYILQKFHWSESIQAVRDWSRCLEYEGLLHIIVPSRRWIARNMLQETIEPHVAPLLFGDAGHLPHQSIYSISDLRAIIDTAHLACVKAKVGQVTTQIGEEQFDAEQCYVVGQKSEYLEDTQAYE